MIPVSKPSTGQKEVEMVNNVFDSNWLGLGEFVSKFEEQICEKLCVKNAVAVNTGTSAKFLALEALGINAGDEIIVPSLTFCATIHALTMLGAKPVFCEVTPETLCIDPEDVKKRISPRTRAVLPVHYCGIAAPMDKILEISGSFGIRVVEDAAHAFGSFYNGKQIGSIGDLTCFSFDPIKNITCGEGGAITTNDDMLAEVLRKKRNLGISRNSWLRRKEMNQPGYEVIMQGYRYHMNNINAAIGLSQLKKFDFFHGKKTEVVRSYNEAFSIVDEIKLLKWDLKATFPFMYIMLVPGNVRDNLREFLRKRNIETLVNYTPNHLQPFFSNGQKLPVTERLYNEIITLPLFADMTHDELHYIIESVLMFFKKE